MSQNLFLQPSFGAVFLMVGQELQSEPDAVPPKKGAVRMLHPKFLAGWPDDCSSAASDLSTGRSMAKITLKATEESTSVWNRNDGHEASGARLYRPRRSSDENDDVRTAHWFHNLP